MIFVRVTRMIVGSNVPVRLSNNLIEFALKGSWTWSVVVFADSKKESSRLVLPLPANKWSCLPPLRFWDLSSALQFLFLGDHRSFLLLLRVPDTWGWKLNLSLVNQSPALLHPATTFPLRLLTNQVSFGVESHIKFCFFFHSLTQSLVLLICFGGCESDRIGEVKRVTKETNVSVKINLDGTGVADSSTGIPFLDHMLDVLSVFDLF